MYVLEHDVLFVRLISNKEAMFVKSFEVLAYALSDAKLSLTKVMRLSSTT